MEGIARLFWSPNPSGPSLVAGTVGVTLGKDWIEKIKSGGKDYIPHVRSALLDGLVPSAYPVGIPVEDGRIFTPVDNLNAFFGRYTLQQPRIILVA